MPSPVARPVRFLRRALGPLADPAILDFWTREFGSTASRTRVLARVVARREESARAITLELQPNRRFTGFTPGQHDTRVVEVDGRISLSVQKVEGGVVSGHLYSRIGVGDVVELGAAFGQMTLPTVLPERLLFLAAGSGITPLMSLTRELDRRGMPVPTTLIYWARHRSDLCFLPELRALAAREPDFVLRIALTGDAATATDELRGRPGAGLFTDTVPDLARRAVFACGPAGFVEQVGCLVKPVARSFTSEAFTPPRFAAAESAQEVTVMLARSNRVLRVPTGQPLLVALEAQGLRPRSGCRMGICNTCACPKRDGLTRDLKNGGDSAGPDANLRICINGAQSDLTLDL